MIIVRKSEQGEWTLWIGDYVHTVTDKMATLTRADGLQYKIEDPMGPCNYEVRNNGGQVLHFYRAGIWSVEDVVRAGGRIVDEFVVPEGERLINGSLRVVELPDGSVIQTGETEPIPPPKANGFLSGNQAE